MHFLARGSSGKRHCSSTSHRSASSNADSNLVSESSDHTKNVLVNTLLSAKRRNSESLNEKEVLPNSSEINPESSTNENCDSLPENCPETSPTDGNVVDPAVSECLCNILLLLKKELKESSGTSDVVSNTISVCT